MSTHGTWSIFWEQLFYIIKEARSQSKQVVKWLNLCGNTFVAKFIQVMQIMQTCRQKLSGKKQVPKIFATRLATLLEGAGLAFDFQKCSNFPKPIMVVLKL